MENQPKIAHASPRWVRLWRLYGRTLALILAMVAGVLCPQAQTASNVLQYLLMGMLFFSFLDIAITRKTFHGSILVIFFANVAIPLLIYVLIFRVNPDLAVTGFITAIAPTATATPVIIGFLRGRVEYVVTSVFLTNVGIALLLPFMLPLVAGSARPVSTAEVLPPVLLVMFVPLILAGLVRRLPLRAQSVIRKGKPASFALWLLVLFVVTAKASAFLQENASIPVRELAEIALLSLATCVLNFALGAWIGGRAFRREASQALGQKNNSFTIWVALTYLNPLAALGPTFYVLYHNLYNGYQLVEYERNIHAYQPPDPSQ